MDVAEQVKRLPYIKGVRDTSRGSERFVAVDDVLKLLRMRDAACAPGAGAKISCSSQGCLRTASFIQEGKTFCLEHAKLP